MYKRGSEVGEPSTGAETGIWGAGLGVDMQGTGDRCSEWWGRSLDIKVDKLWSLWCEIQFTA